MASPTLITAQDVINFLTSCGANTAEASVPTIQIAKQFYGGGARRKTLNPLLYAMERRGEVRKVCNENGGKPAWFVILPAPILSESLPTAQKAGEVVCGGAGVP